MPPFLALMNPTLIVAIVAVVALLAVLLFRRRAPAQRDGGHEPLRSRREQPLSRPLSTGTPRDLGTMASTSGRGGSVFPFTADAAVEAVSDFTTELPVPGNSEFPMTNVTGEASTRERAPSRAPGKGAASRVEYHQPAEGTLQFLPGRLIVVEGEEQQRHEIRFVRHSGGRTEVTFGRNAGEPYRHVQLHSRTVSRLHAKLEFDNDAWSVTNLSSTNPTLLNGEPLAQGDETRVLREGDTIEMGEVMFKFREK